MRKHFKVILSLLTLTGVLVIPYLVFAQVSADSGEGDASMLNKLTAVAMTGGYVVGENSSLTLVVGLIIQTVLSLLGAIFVILMIYAGYTWMLASGNESKVDKAQSMIKTSIIGLIITLSSWAIWSLIFNNFINK